MSPDFLFRIEADPAGAAPGSVYRISDVELASRLSFALWSSIPDDTLLDLAIRGKLHEPAVLEQQVSRMFADPRARTSLVQNFFEDWLQTRNVWLLNPDSTKFPWFDDNLRTAFVTETEMFLDAQLKEDRSILDLLTSNETFLNEQLARHYGIPDVYGSHFRRVKLTDENRFGLLGKASVLAVTSYTTRTSPTIRGKWLLENILAAPMPPPPPNVPCAGVEQQRGQAAIGPGNAGDASRQSGVRQLPRAHGPAGVQPGEFRRHRAVAHDRRGPAPSTHPACCWTARKSKDRRRCSMPSWRRRSSSSRAVTEKLLTYSLGRGLEYYDAPAIRAIDRAAAVPMTIAGRHGFGDREERAVSDEEVRFMIVTKEGAFAPHDAARGGHGRCVAVARRDDSGFRRRRPPLLCAAWASSTIPTA